MSGEICTQCRDGLIFTKNQAGITHVSACSCPMGKSQQQAMFAPSDKNKERPIKLREWSGGYARSGASTCAKSTQIAEKGGGLKEKKEQWWEK